MPGEATYCHNLRALITELIQHPGSYVGVTTVWFPRIVASLGTRLQSAQSVLSAAFTLDGLSSATSGDILRVTGSPSAFDSAGGGL
jgi:hypothetical protein